MRQRARTDVTPKTATSDSADERPQIRLRSPRDGRAVRQRPACTGPRRRAGGRIARDDQRDRALPLSHAWPRLVRADLDCARDRAAEAKSPRARRSAAATMADASAGGVDAQSGRSKAAREAARRRGETARRRVDVRAAAELAARRGPRQPRLRAETTSRTISFRCVDAPAADTRPPARLVEPGRHAGLTGIGPCSRRGHHRPACSLVASPSPGAAAAAGALRLFFTSARACSSTFCSLSRNVLRALLDGARLLDAEPGLDGELVLVFAQQVLDASGSRPLRAAESSARRRRGRRGAARDR